MILKWNDIVKKEGSISKAYTSQKKQKYKKVSHGFYVEDNYYTSEVEQIFARYPRAVLTMQSAFDYYNMSDYIPEKYHIVTPYNAHTIDNPKVIQTYMDEKLMAIGKETVYTKYGYMNIFDKERMLIELFRLKSKLPHSYFLEVVSSYRTARSSGLISMKTVSEYSKHFKRGEKLLNEIQEMI